MPQGALAQFHIAVTAVLAGVGGVPILDTGGIPDGNDVGMGQRFYILLVRCTAFAGISADTGCGTSGRLSDFPGVGMFMDGGFCS